MATDRNAIAEATRPTGALNASDNSKATIGTAKNQHNDKPAQLQGMLAGNAVAHLAHADMPRKRYKPKETVAKLRQIDVFASQGASMADDAIRQLGVLPAVS